MVFWLCQWFKQAHSNHWIFVCGWFAKKKIRSRWDHKVQGWIDTGS